MANIFRDPRRMASMGILLLLGILFVLYIRFNAGYAVDDSYITFRYAQNALEGHGFVFNVGQKYYGSTATGYAILLYLAVKGLSLLGILVDLHQVATVFSAVSLTMIAWVCVSVMEPASRSPARWLAAALVAVVIFILPASSIVAAHETYTYLGLLALASHAAIFRKRVKLCAALLVLATLCRPDSLLFALILFGSLFVQRLMGGGPNHPALRELVRGVVIYAVGLVVWLLAMKWYYGTFFPGTMDAKKAQVLLGDFPLFTFGSVKAGLDQQMAGSYWILMGFVVVAMLGSTAKRLVTERFRSRLSEKTLFAVVWTVFAIGLMCAYLMFNVTIWMWYVTPIALALALATVGTFAAFTEESEGTQASRMFWYGASATFVGMVFVMSQPSGAELIKRFARDKNVNTHLQSYDPIVAYLRANEPHGTTVAIAEPGTFGFKLGPAYQVYDVLGLASPGVAKALLSGDRNYVIREWRPKYVVVSWQGHYSPDQQPGFSALYEPVGEFRHSYWDQTIKRGAMLYRIR